MFQNVDTPGMSYALSELGIKGNPSLPVVDSHRIRGGAMAVTTLADRNDIPAELRKANVTSCYVADTQKTYVLRNGIANSNWVEDGTGATPVAPTLEVGAFIAQQNGVVGTAVNISLPTDLFRAQGQRTVSIVSVIGLPAGVTYEPSTRSIGNIPTQSGRFWVIVNGQDSDGNKAQNVFLLVIAASTVTEAPVVQPAIPTTVGSAALNIVMTNTAECSVILTTPGFAETGLEAFAVATPSRRFVGGTDVENCLFLGSSGYSNVSGGIGYFSFAWAVNQFKSRYPSATVADFDVYVRPIATSPNYVNRVNYSSEVSFGLQKITINNGIDYAYASKTTSQGGFWHYDAGTGVGQQNTLLNLHEQFTITGNIKKKIGVQSINLVTGVSKFTPIGLETLVDNRPFCSRGPTFVSLTVNSATSLRVNYDGLDLTSIDWKIEQADSVVRTGNSGTLTNSFFDITLSSALPAGTYTLVLDGTICKTTDSAGSRRSFSIEGVVSEVETRPFCSRGPTFVSLTVNSATSLRVNYDGLDLTSIDWKIEQAGSVVRTGNSGTLTDPFFNIALSSALPAGDYALVLDGKTCKTTDPVAARRSFSIEGVVSQVETRPFCSRGPTFVSLTVNSATSLRVNYDGLDLTSIDWKIEQAGSAVRTGNSGILTDAFFNIALSSALPDGTYTLVLDGTTCKTTDPVAARRAFTVAGSVAPSVETRPFCSRGPTVTGLTVNSPNSLLVYYDGLELSSINWKIEQDGGVVRDGNSGTLTTNFFTIALSTILPVGDYTLVLDGVTCKTTDPVAARRAFTITAISQVSESLETSSIPTNDDPATYLDLSAEADVSISGLPQP